MMVKLTSSCKQLFTTAFVAGEAVVTHLGLGRHAILIKKPTTFAKVLPAFFPLCIAYFPCTSSISILLNLRGTNHASSTAGHPRKRNLI